jgi:hypothetical protein
VARTFQPALPLTVTEGSQNVVTNLANELLYRVNSTTRWFRSEVPDEDILFASAATYGVFQSGRRMGWGRKGVLILTRRQVFFKSVWRSLYTLMFLAAGLISFIAYAVTVDILFLIVAILAVAATFNRLPLQRQIPLSDIQSVQIGSVRGLTLRGFREMPELDIIIGDYTLRFTLNQALTGEAKRVLGVRGEVQEDDCC